MMILIILPEPIQTNSGAHLQEVASSSQGFQVKVLSDTNWPWQKKEDAHNKVN